MVWHSVIQAFWWVGEWWQLLCELAGVRWGGTLHGQSTPVLVTLHLDCPVPSSLVILCLQIGPGNWFEWCHWFAGKIQLMVAIISCFQLHQKTYYCHKLGKARGKGYTSTEALSNSQLALTVTSHPFLLPVVGGLYVMFHFCRDSPGLATTCIISLHSTANIVYIQLNGLALLVLWLAHSSAWAQ